MVLNAVRAWVEDALRAPFITAETIVTLLTVCLVNVLRKRITAEDKLAGSYWVLGIWGQPRKRATFFVLMTLITVSCPVGDPRLSVLVGF